MDELTKEKVETFWDGAWTAFPQPTDALVDDPLYVGPDLDLGWVAGKRVMVCSCGTGRHVVSAVRAGGDVLAVDISQVGVDRAEQVCRANGVIADFLVADLAATGLPSNSVDLAWGEAVLHHLDHETFARELDRLLVADGRAVFVWEPTFFNPLFRWGYEACFGKGRENRRRNFLFVRRRGDEFEKPIDDADLAPYERYFVVDRSPQEFMFFRKISDVAVRHRRARRFCRRLDNWFDRRLPFVRRFGYAYDITMRRRSSAD